MYSHGPLILSIFQDYMRRVHTRRVLRFGEKVEIAYDLHGLGGGVQHAGLVGPSLPEELLCTINIEVVRED